MTTKQISPLVSGIANELRDKIVSREYVAGHRLPSESELTRRHSVSRTVVREAIAVLRAEGLVAARKGSGVFVLDGPAAATKPFSDLDVDKVSSATELLELRSAVEIRSAGLAAARRSAAQLERLLQAHDAVRKRFDAGEPTRDADFEFHYAIAEATQNRRFPEFLTVVREGIVPRVVLSQNRLDPRLSAPNPHLIREHEAIVDAIVDADPAAAEAAMTAHLDSSLRRYRDLLRARTA